MRAILTLLAIVFIGGCGGTTAQELRTSAPIRHKYTVADNYQKVYRRILQHAREKYPAVLLSVAQAVEGDIYPDTQTATIGVVSHSFIGGSKYRHIVDLKAINDNLTQVATYHRKFLFDKNNDKIDIERWAKNVGQSPSERGGQTAMR